MAYQTGNIRYRGSFKSIRHWNNAHDNKTYAGEKGGASRDEILNNPVFARTRENMMEFEGCARIVKAIRRGLYNLIPEHTDTHFTSRLVALVKMINLKDDAGVRGKRAFSFSLNRPILRILTFHEKKKIDHQLRRSISTSHPESRAEVTIRVNGLNPDPQLVPASAQFYRVIIHISTISDRVYDENVQRYEPLSPADTMNAIAYSDYTAVNTPLNATLKAMFPEGTMLDETATVLQCVGIEFYIRSGTGEYLRFSEGSMLVFDVF